MFNNLFPNIMLFLC